MLPLNRTATRLRRKYPGPEGRHKRDAITEAEDHLGAVLEILQDPLYKDIHLDILALIAEFNKEKA